MSRFMTTSSKGNGKRRRTIEAAGLEEKDLAALLHEAFAGLSPPAGIAHGDIKLEVKVTGVKIESHEHKYFVLSSPSAEERQYTVFPAPGGRRDPSDAADEDTRKWRQEVEQFERLKDALWRKPELRLKFVAIHGGQVVDHDSDKFALARRVRHKFPGEVVLIARVQRGTRVAEMPSPELD